MDREMENLKSYDVYELVLRTFKLGWVLHRKFRIGLFERNKGRLVARSNHQRPGIDYGESFSPVMRLESLRTILALAAIRGLDVIQFDITSAHLHGALKEEVYMVQPEGYVAPGKEDWAWRFKKGLYGLVQAGRTWNEELNAHMEGEGVTETPKDPTMYIKNSWTDRDFAAAGDSCGSIGSRKELTAPAESVNAKYGMTGLGEVRWVLGMLLERDRPYARSRHSRRRSSTPFSRDSTSPKLLLSRRPSPQALTFPRTTVLPRRTKLRWQIGRIGRL